MVQSSDMLSVSFIAKSMNHDIPPRSTKPSIATLLALRHARPAPYQANRKQYAPLLFQQAGLNSSEASFLASGVSAICIFAFTIIAVIFVDRWGRRASTIYGGLVLFTCMAVMGTLYASKSVHGDSGAGRWIVILTIYIFAIAYAMSKSL